MPIDDALMENLTNLTDPVVHVNFGAPQAQRRFATHRYQVLPLAAVQAAVFDVPDLLRIATREHLRHQAASRRSGSADGRVETRPSDRQRSA